MPDLSNTPPGVLTPAERAKRYRDKKKGLTVPPSPRRRKALNLCEVAFAKQLLAGGNPDATRSLSTIRRRRKEVLDFLRGDELFVRFARIARFVGMDNGHDQVFNLMKSYLAQAEWMELEDRLPSLPVSNDPESDAKVRARITHYCDMYREENARQKADAGAGADG